MWKRGGGGRGSTYYTHVMNDLAPCADFSVSEAGATKKLLILDIKNNTRTTHWAMCRRWLSLIRLRLFPSMGQRGRRPSNI